METTKMTEKTNADFVNFIHSLDDDNPCSSCKIRLMMLELMENKE